MKPPADFFGPPGPDGRYWCGPAAICWALGVPYREAHARLGMGRRGWTTASAVLEVLRSYGVQVPAHGPAIRLMPRKALYNFAPAHAEGTYFVRVGGHFLVLRDGLVYDNLRAGFVANQRWLVTHAVNLKGSNDEPL